MDTKEEIEKSIAVLEFNIEHREKEIAALKQARDFLKQHPNALGIVGVVTILAQDLVVIKDKV